MWQRYTERARRVIFYAQEEAQRFGKGYVSTEHFLLGLIREEESNGTVVLVEMGIKIGDVKASIEAQIDKSEKGMTQDMTLTPGAKRVIDCAYDEARNLDNNYIGTEHLLLGLIRERDGLAARTLLSLGATLEDARKKVTALQDKKKSQESSPVTPPKANVDSWADYSPTGKATIYRAFSERAKYVHQTISPEHLLLAVIGDPDTLAVKVLIDLGATPDRIRLALEAEFLSNAGKSDANESV